jgi:protocatechuate 3,4-dioxygenase beta subunit
VTPGTQGRALVVSGVVRDTACRPIANARLDFWQADGAGSYDNQGFRLRGSTSTDAQGRYRLTTVYPGLYPGRTRHIHVKVSAPGGSVLTTQLFFPGVPQNASDGIFDPTTLVKLTRTGTPWRATFSFVVRR